MAVNIIGDNKFTEDSESEDPRLVNQKVLDEFLLLQSNFKDSEGELVDPALIEAVARLVCSVYIRYDISAQCC